MLICCERKTLLAGRKILADKFKRTGMQQFSPQLLPLETIKFLIISLSLQLSLAAIAPFPLVVISSLYFLITCTELLQFQS